MYIPAIPSPGRDRVSRRFDRLDRVRLIAFYGFIASLHAVGWGLYLHHAARNPALVGIGLTAYLLGLRHAFDADHIAAVDDTVRFLLQKGRNPLGVGFWFSLGHATVVLLVAVAIACAADTIRNHLPAIGEVGSVVGAAVSGVFLWFVGLLNLFVLLDVLTLWTRTRHGRHDHAAFDRLLLRGGWFNRIFAGRLQRVIDRSWQMYPLGLLFGLGFDTATEIGLLGMTAGASASLPIGAVLSLPILFAAGMSMVDTTDGVLMANAYDWALANPLRRIFYNVVTTALSVAVALTIGTVELLQLGTRLFGLDGGLFEAIRHIDFEMLGYAIVGSLLCGWGLSVAWWKFRGPAMWSR